MVQLLTRWINASLGLAASLDWLAPLLMRIYFGYFWRPSSASLCRSKCPSTCAAADAEAAAGSGVCARYVMDMG